MSSTKGEKERRRYLRINVFPVEAVLSHVFTREVRHELRLAGHSYNSKEWKQSSKRYYPGFLKGKPINVPVSMGSHRYQLFKRDGTKCTSCHIVGTYFALERGMNDAPDKYHFNLYGRDDDGVEVMLTKDHVVPRAASGKNKLTNYQVMCYRCNQRKADKVPK